MVDVKGQFGVVEIRVFLDLPVIGLGSGLLECGQGLHLILGLDVGVTHLVVGNLAQGVSAHCHKGVIVNGSLVVSKGILEGSGVEVVGPVHCGVGDGVGIVVLLSLAGVAQDKIGLGKDSGKMSLALLRTLRIDGLAVVHHVPVVLLHEAALQHIVSRIEGEPLVIETLGEPVVRFLEIIVVVLYVAQRIAAGRSVVRIRHSLQLPELGHGLGEVPHPVVAVSLLEEQFSTLPAVDGDGRDGCEALRGGGVLAVIEQHVSVQEVDFRRKGGFDVSAFVVGEDALVSGGPGLQGAKHYITVCKNVRFLLGKVFKNASCFIVKPSFIKGYSSLEVLVRICRRGIHLPSSQKE